MENTTSKRIKSSSSQNDNKEDTSCEDNEMEYDNEYEVNAIF